MDLVDRRRLPTSSAFPGFEAASEEMSLGQPVEGVGLSGGVFLEPIEVSCDVPLRELGQPIPADPAEESPDVLIPGFGLATRRGPDALGMSFEVGYHAGH